MGIETLIGGGLGLLGAVTGRKDAKNQAQAAKDANQAQIDANKVDPRITDMLFGAGGDAGLLSQYKGMLSKPQDAGLAKFGQATDNYLGYGAPEDRNFLRETAYKQMNANQAQPGMAAASSGAAAINAPSQNRVDLQGSFDKLVNGNPAENTYLKTALQGSMDQSRNIFNQMQGDAKSSLDGALSGIRSNSVLAGQYGGSRQGIAEGNALGDFAKAQQQTINQFGQNNTNAAVGAQAQAFNQGQDRALSATLGLSGQQYGAASQNAAMQQQSMLNNAGLLNDAYKTNLSSALSTNALNAATQQNGMSNLNGIMGGALAAGQNQDQYDLNKTINVNQGLLQPYLNKNATPTQLTPVYNNTGANAIGGAAAGLSMYNMFNNINKPIQPYGGAIGNSSQPYGSNGSY